MPNERTILTPGEEIMFRQWATQNGIQNYDDPRALYDMRGFWKATQGAPHPPGEQMHFPDTFKQHGHPSFSVESNYSQGPWDGGRWLQNPPDQNDPAVLARNYSGTNPRLSPNDLSQYVPPGADLMVNSRGQSRLPMNDLANALQVLVNNGLSGPQ
jgi:hypothetical protein